MSGVPACITAQLSVTIRRHSQRVDGPSLAASALRRRRLLVPSTQLRLTLSLEQLGPGGQLLLCQQQPVGLPLSPGWGSASCGKERGPSATATQRSRTRAPPQKKKSTPVRAFPAGAEGTTREIDRCNALARRVATSGQFSLARNCDDRHWSLISRNACRISAQLIVTHTHKSKVK